MKILPLLFLFSLLSAKSITPTEENVQSMGRVLWDENGASYDWCGTRFDFSFTGTSLGLTFSDAGNHYDITLDGVYHSRIKNGSGDTTVHVAENLHDGEHTVTVERRTEQPWNIASLKAIHLDETGTLLAAPPKPEKRILILGDSYSVGYGTEHDSRIGTDEDYVNTTNTAKAFGSLVGKHYAADYSTIGYSGKGLIRNLGADSPGKEYPVYYDKLFASEVNLDAAAPKLWDHKSWIPHIVVVHLGGNDFGGEEAEPADTTEWVSAYNDFIDLLLSDFPEASVIVCATSFWPHNYLRSSARAVVDSANAKGQNVYYYGYTQNSEALHWHPSVKEQKIIADGLIELIDRNNLWNSTTEIAHLSTSHKSAAITSASGGELRISHQSIDADEVAIYAVNGRLLHKSKLDPSGTTVVQCNSLGRQTGVVSVMNRGKSIIVRLVSF